MTLTPRLLRRRTRASRVSTSSSVSEEVGSSITISRAFIESALAISTICRRATFSRPTCSVGSASILSSANNFAVALCMASKCTPRPRLVGSRPAKTFSEMLRCSASISSW